MHQIRTWGAIEKTFTIEYVNNNRMLKYDVRTRSLYISFAHCRSSLYFQYFHGGTMKKKLNGISMELLQRHLSKKCVKMKLSLHFCLLHIHDIDISVSEIITIKRLFFFNRFFDNTTNRITIPFFTFFFCNVNSRIFSVFVQSVLRSR